VNRQDELTYFGYHVVCLIDVLGQKEKLAGWGRIPRREKITPEFVTAIKQTVGTVLTFRDMFTRYFDALDRGPEPGRLAILPPDQKVQYHRFRDSRVSVERFSDTFVFSSQIGNDYGDASTVPVSHVLQACCWAMVVSLAGKTPIRGAVTIGAGAVLEDGSFYGPALAEAHFLESEVADYPRIVVSNDIAMFLTDSQPYSHDPVVADLFRQMADNACSLLTRDSDGHHIVDYLGRSAQALYEEDSVVPRAVPKALGFVRAETDRFRSKGNTKLADRYARLQAYFESRLGFWGISP
jgi:hypothetical protein